MQTFGDGPGDLDEADGGYHGGLEFGEKVTRLRCLRNINTANLDRFFSDSPRSSHNFLTRPKHELLGQRRKRRRVNSKAPISRDIPSPLPAPKVADKTRVPEAFGLQKSRSGRLLVPRLATWRNQSIKYDMDGGIIGISEGFEEAKGESCTGCYNFKTPSHGDARVMQRKFLVAADMAADLVRM